MTVRIAIDLNVRVRGNQTYAAMADADAPEGLTVGEKVLAVEQESGICADATVTSIEPGGIDVDEAGVLVYLAVDWSSFRDDPEATEDPGCE